MILMLLKDAPHMYRASLHVKFQIFINMFLMYMLQQATIIHAAILNVEILPANAVCFIDFGSVLNCLLSIFH